MTIWNYFIFFIHTFMESLIFHQPPLPHYCFSIRNLKNWAKQNKVFSNLQTRAFQTFPVGDTFYPYIIALDIYRGRAICSVPFSRFFLKSILDHVPHLMLFQWVGYAMLMLFQILQFLVIESYCFLFSHLSILIVFTDYTLFISLGSLSSEHF